jgi:hypothetical protein
MLPPDTGVEPARPGDEPGKFWQWAVRGCHKRGDCRAIQGWLGNRSIARKAGFELSAHHYPVHDCTQQVVIAVSHGRVHERIDLALRHTRLVHGLGDRAKNSFASLPTSLTRTLGYLGAVPAARCH